MYYTHTTIDPRPTAEARAANDQVFSAGSVYGIEVTVPALAARCVANLDPQHLGGDASTAAIEAALTWELPPVGVTLATVRPDADSIGAAAILEMRAEQSLGYQDLICDGTYLARDQHGKGVNTQPVNLFAGGKLIADADKEASGPWPGVRPTGTPQNLLRETTALEAMCMDHRLTMGERVTLMRDWLVTGGFAGQDDYRKTALEDARQALAGLDARVVDGIAVVTGSHRLAMSIGYRLAPVVVATNPAFRFGGGTPHVKHTIARWNTATMPRANWGAMIAALNAADSHPAWGGSTSIVGSPQGVGSSLTTEQVVAVAAAHLS
jgi:hypothetical protein